VSTGVVGIGTARNTDVPVTLEFLESEPRAIARSMQADQCRSVAHGRYAQL